MTVPLQPATLADLPSIVAIMNAAFRGTAGEHGWSTEADYITGARTTESLLRVEIAAGALYLLAKDDNAALLGCVSLKVVAPGIWYLGSLAVAPALQNAGLGRKLLTAAEFYAAQHGARTIEITVINIRETMIAWYERRGYQRTGETRLFPYEDHRFGTPTRKDLDFVVLSKPLSDLSQSTPNHP